jgi:hypothetical protein
LAWCESATIRMNRFEGTLDLRDGRFYRVMPPLSLRTWLRNSERGRNVVGSGVGRTIGLHRLAYPSAPPHEGLRGRLQDSTPVRRSSRSRSWRALVGATYLMRAGTNWCIACIADPQLAPSRIRQRGQELRTGPATPESTQGKNGRARAGSLMREIAWLLRRAPSVAVALLPLHTNASGDFTLMSRVDWEKTEAYPELETYSMHIDGLELYMAHYAGIDERFIPFPIYHIEHSGGFQPEADGERSLGSDLARRSIPQISDAQWNDMIVGMWRTRTPLAFGQPRWGLSRSELPELDVTPSVPTELTPSEAKTSAQSRA